MNHKKIWRFARRGIIALGISLAGVLTLGMGSVTFAATPLGITVGHVPNYGMEIASGATVTYFYQITNSGADPVTNLTINDDKCTLVTYDGVNMDHNADHKLDQDETWTYFCTTRLGATTSSTITVNGEVNGEKVAAGLAKTVVVPPEFTMPGGGAAIPGGGSAMPGQGSSVGGAQGATGGLNGGTVPGGMPNTGKAAASKKHVKSNTVGKISIPAIKLDTDVREVGLTANGDMAAPRGAMDAGWYKFGFKPGEKGNAVIAGHLDTYKNTDGVFRNINRLQAGDDIYITGESGTQTHFIVRATDTYDGESAPLADIFGASDKPRLNLITCAGAWDSKKHMYSHRLVVSAEMD